MIPWIASSKSNDQQTWDKPDKNIQNASLCSAKYAAGALFFTSYFLKGDSVSKDGAVMNVDYCLEMRFKTPCRV